MQASFATTAATVSYADGESISYASSGQYLTKFQMGKSERDIRPVYSPGEDGGGSQDFGTRYQDFTIEVIYIAADEEAANASAQVDLVTLARVSDADFSGFSFVACKLEDSEFEQARPALINVTVQMKGKLKFRCFRPNG